MSDPDFTAETLGLPKALDSAARESVSHIQLRNCERLVDELLKVQPDDALVMTLMEALQIPPSGKPLERISQVFEKLESLLKNHNPEKDAHDLPKHS